MSGNAQDSDSSRKGLWGRFTGKDNSSNAKRSWDKLGSDLNRALEGLKNPLAYNCNNKEQTGEGVIREFKHGYRTYNVEDDEHIYVSEASNKIDFDDQMIRLENHPVGNIEEPETTEVEEASKVVDTRALFTKAVWGSSSTGQIRGVNGRVEDGKVVDKPAAEKVEIPTSMFDKMKRVSVPDLHDDEADILIMDSADDQEESPVTATVVSQPVEVPVVNVPEIVVEQSRFEAPRVMAPGVSSTPMVEASAVAPIMNETPAIEPVVQTAVEAPIADCEAVEPVAEVRAPVIYIAPRIEPVVQAVVEEPSYEAPAIVAPATAQPVVAPVVIEPVVETYESVVMNDAPVEAQPVSCETPVAEVRAPVIYIAPRIEPVVQAVVEDPAPVAETYEPVTVQPVVAPVSYEASKVEPTVVVEPENKEFRIFARAEIPASMPKGLYIEGQEPSDQATSSSEVAKPTIQQMAETSCDVATRPMMYGLSMDGDGMLPPMADPVKRRPSRAMRFKNGVLVNVGRTGDRGVPRGPLE